MSRTRWLRGWVPSFTALRWVHLRRIAQHPVRVALAVTGIGAGVALALAVTVSATSVERSLDTFGTNLAGPARFRVVGPTGHGGLPEGAVTTIEAVDGVDQAIPLVMGVTEASSGGGDRFLVAFVGADCRVLTLVGGEACDVVGVPEGDTDADPIISSRLGRMLGNGTIHTNLGDRSVAAVPQFDLLDAFNEGMVAIYPLPTAQDLFTRPGSVDAVYVVPSPGTDPAHLRAALEEAVGPSAVVRDASSALAPDYITGPFLPFLFLLSLFGLAVGAQLVQNIVVLSLAERRREFAVTAALGGPPRALAAGVLAESAAMGVLGGVVGIVAGVLVAKPFVDNISDQAELAAGIHLSVHVTPFAVAAGLALGVATSVLATVRPAWRLRRLEISGELTDRPAHDHASSGVPVARVALMTGVVVLGLVAGWLGQRGGALEPWQPPVAIAALGVAGAMAFRLGAFAPALFGALSRIPVLQRGAARVALNGLTADPRRVAAASLAVGAAVGLSVGIGNADLAAGSQVLADATAEGRVFVSTLRPNNTTTIDAKVPPPLAAELARFPGVAGVERHFHTTIDHPRLGSTALEGTDGTPAEFDVIKGVPFAEAADRGEVMVGPALARSLGLDPGEQFVVPGREGLVKLRVGGIWKSPDNLGRSISAPYPLFRRLAGAQPPDSLLLVPEPGLAAADLARQVRAAALDPRLNVFDPAELGQRYAEDFGDFVQPFRIIQRGLLVVAFVATVSTLLLAALQRRREHGLLMALGMAPAGLGRMVMVEAGLIALAGTAFGWVSGVVGGQLFVFASPVVTGLEVPLTLSLMPVITAGALAFAFVLAGAALPAWRTSRLDPMVALRYE